jgi:Fe-Mn family superoxide dismutase
MKKIILLGLVVTLALHKISTAQGQVHLFEPLPYSYDALEPYIDKATMEIHYDRHHRAYYNNFISVAKGTEAERVSLEETFSKISEYQPALRNNAGGFWNHAMFWNCMKPKGGGEPAGKLIEAITKEFGSFDNFKKQFAEAGMKRFGSGWAWLVMAKDGSLFITSTANQDNPLMNTEPKQGIPLLCVDVWEHAYYLKYQNKRADYLNAFWNVVNWEYVQQRYEKIAPK